MVIKPDGNLSIAARKAARAPFLPYHDQEFMDGDEARPLRILAEYIGPLSVFRNQGVRDTIVFFGSARQGPDGPFGRYYEDARRLAFLLTQWSTSMAGKDGRFLVCSGGGGGMMAAANQGAAEAGGRSIGLNISLPREQKPNPHITPGLSLGFHYFFMRKLWFAHLARAMVFFPGGFGTLDEFFEVLTLAQTGKLARRPAILLYGTEYWKGIVDFDALVRKGMVSSQDLDLFRYAEDPDEALAILKESLPVEPEPSTPAFVESVDSAAEGPDSPIVAG